MVQLYIASNEDDYFKVEGFIRLQKNELPIIGDIIREIKSIKYKKDLDVDKIDYYEGEVIGIDGNNFRYQGEKLSRRINCEEYTKIYYSISRRRNLKLKQIGI